MLDPNRIRTSDQSFAVFSGLNVQARESAIRQVVSIVLKALITLEEKAPYRGPSWVSHFQQHSAAALVARRSNKAPFTEPLVIAR